MGRPENLIPLNNRTKTEQTEITRMGGIASGKARREKKRRGEVLKEIMNTKVTDPKMLAFLEKMGIHKDDPTYEDLVNARATMNTALKGNMQDLQRANDEMYGKQDVKTQLELSGEITGININVKRFDAEGKDEIKT